MTCTSASVILKECIEISKCNIGPEAFDEFKKENGLEDYLVRNLGMVKPKEINFRKPRTMIPTLPNGELLATEKDCVGYYVPFLPTLCQLVNNMAFMQSLVADKINDPIYNIMKDNYIRWGICPRKYCI